MNEHDESWTQGWTTKSRTYHFPSEDLCFKTAHMGISWWYHASRTQKHELLLTTRGHSINLSDDRLETQPPSPSPQHVDKGAKRHKLDDEIHHGWWTQTSGVTTRWIHMCALCTQTTPWFSTNNTDCEGCEQSGMDDGETNAFWPDSQPCMACCTPNLFPNTANRHCECGFVKTLWSIIAQANRLTVNGIDTTNTTPISWRHTVPTIIQKKEGRTHGVTWHTVLCIPRHGWDGCSAMTSSPKPFHFLNDLLNVLIWQHMPTPSPSFILPSNTLPFLHTHDRPSFMKSIWSRMNNC